MVLALRRVGGMLMKEAWRLLRCKNGKPHTLMHGYHGSKELTQDRVLRAVQRDVRNPGKQVGPTFVSGWHVLFDKAEVEAYRKRFKDDGDLVTCRVSVACCEPKPRSPANVQLARYLKIDSLDWAKALESHGPV